MLPDNSWCFNWKNMFDLKGLVKFYWQWIEININIPFNKIFLSLFNKFVLFINYLHNLIKKREENKFNLFSTEWNYFLLLQNKWNCASIFFNLNFTSSFVVLYKSKLKYANYCYTYDYEKEYMHYFSIHSKA